MLRLINEFLLSENHGRSSTPHSSSMKKSYEPLDLSRRCDSVDTMKTPSPYSAGGSSPPLENSPPTSHHNRSVEYSDHSPPHNSAYPQSLQEYSSSYQKRDSPSPDFIYYGKQHNQTCNLSPYMIQAAALQQRLQHTPPAEDDSSETSSLNKHMVNSYPFQMVVGRDGKLARPFKAYPRDNHLSSAAFPFLSAQSTEKFEIFRSNMLKHIHAANGGQPTISNPKMRRTSSRAESTHTADSESIINNNNSDSSNSGVKDSAYYERRKKNNAAAKKSRDRRRIKEDEIAIRATFLENENREFQAELVSARNQVNELKSELTAVRKRLAMYGGADCL